MKKPGADRNGSTPGLGMAETIIRIHGLSPSDTVAI